MLRLFFVILLFPILFYSQNSNISLLDTWTSDSLPYCYDEESVFNEVWGFSINGSDYAVIGSTAGAHFFNINNDQLDEVAFVPGKYIGSQAIHRDYHDYSGYLYAVCDENLSSLQIMDLSYLPDSVPLVYDSDELIVRAHNIFIDTAVAKLYVLSATSTTQFKPMSVYDISSPIDPQFLYSYDNVSHVHDAYVYNDTAYLNCGSEGLKVIKSVNNFPVQIGELTNYLDNGYNHSGWLNKSKTTYIMCDETYGMNIKAINVSDLDDLQTESLFNSDMGDDDNSVAHNVIVRNDIAYVSYYHDGLQIFDISNPSNVKKLGFFDTYNDVPTVSWAGAWGVYPFRNGERILVSDRANGLFLIGFDVPQFIDEGVQKEVKVFPNPAQDYIYFFREHFGIADYDLTLIDVFGRELRSFNPSIDLFKIKDLSYFKPGIYFLSYSSNKEAVSYKVKFLNN